MFADCKLSNWSLRVNDTHMNQKYLNYQRRDVYKHAKYLLIISGLILGVLTGIIIANIGDDGRLPTLFFYFFLLAVPAAFLTLAMLLAKKKIVFVDCFGTVYMSGFAIAALGLTLTD